MSSFQCILPEAAAANAKQGSAPPPESAKADYFHYICSIINHSDSIFATVKNIPNSV